ncbi:FtsX-like permease family protein [Paractinoplanes globisporus]|uniref:FtsX-like permease family protein n=1 Tax=Paractinoplanes globisporus TaxID=113565 RepID=A0ABW6WK04_9ACTN|nr:FtsX-like permease family protein [Actinoplanes globisporus]
MSEVVLRTRKARGEWVMGRSLLVLRLAWRDLRRRPVEAILALLVMAAATTTLAIGLALHGVTDHPYEQTRSQTAGPDAVAGFLSEGGAPPTTADVDAVTRLPGVTAHGAPMPLAHTTLSMAGRTATVQALGRAPDGDPVDRPLLTSGSWIGAGSVVLERAFADAIGARVGDQVSLGGQSFRVGGTAVSAALPAYPSSLCHLLCFAGVAPGPHAFDLGLVWLTPADLAKVHDRTTPAVVYLIDLRLSDPSSAPAFAAAHGTLPGPGASGPFVLSWQQIRDADAGVTRSAQAALQVGAVLLALLAVAGLAVLAGRRTLEQTRRVGLLKAVGGTPALIALVLLVEHVALALLAAGAGLGLGRVLAGRFTGPGAGLLGSPGPVSLTGATVAVVFTAALLVALAATLLPALRSARSATITALEAPARTPRRDGRLIALSAGLPVPLLLGLRLIGRRPGRAVLSVLSTAVTVTGLVAILTSATVAGRDTGGLHNLRTERLTQVTATITVMLLVLAAVNIVFLTSATVADARHTSAVARAFGATPSQVAGGLSAAQVVPAGLGALVGAPAGLIVYRLVTRTSLTMPSPAGLAAVLVGVVLAVVVCTAIPAGIGARRPVADVLSADTA